MPTSRRSPRKQDPQEIAAIRRRHVLILLLTIAATFLSALPGELVWTDHATLIDGEQRIQSSKDLFDAARLTTAQFRSRLDGPPIVEASGSWQPLVTLWYSFGWTLWRDCALCWRIEALVWHFAAALGLLALGRHLLSQRRRGYTVALWSAMAFAVHPVVVPMIATTQTRPILMSSALAIWALVVFTRLPATSKSHVAHFAGWPIWLTGLAAAAIGAYELALLLPLAGLLIAGFESVERARPGLSGISRTRRMGLLLLSGIVLAWATYRMLFLGGIALSGSYPTDSLLSNAGTAIRLFWTQIGVVLIPGEPVLSDAFPITLRWGAKEVAGLLLLLVWLGATAVGLLVRHPAGLGSMWFLLWMLPASGLLPADRYYSEAALYPAVWGLYFGIAFALMQLWRPLSRQLARGSESIVYAPLVFVIAFITALSNVRFWSDRGLFESEIDNDPSYIEGRAVLARLSSSDEFTTAPMNQALNAIEASQDKSFTGYYPRFDIYSRLGLAQLNLELHDAAEASFDTALQVRPRSASAHYRRARARMGLKDYQGATQDLIRTLQLRPDYPEAQADLGIIQIRQGEYASGLKLLLNGLEIGHDGHAQRSAVAEAYLQQNSLTEAEQHLLAALTHKENAMDRAKLAWIRLKLGNFAEAQEDINMALQLGESSDDYVLQVAREISAAAQSN